MIDLMDITQEDLKRDSPASVQVTIKFDGNPSFINHQAGYTSTMDQLPWVHFKSQGCLYPEGQTLQFWRPEEFCYRGRVHSRALYYISWEDYREVSPSDILAPSGLKKYAICML
jgi:hypothetical protein